LAGCNEIKTLAATPAILPFLKPSRPNSPRTQSALGKRRAIAERPAAAADADVLADLRFQAATNSVFPEGNVAGVTVAHASPLCSATAMEGTCGDS
jgi:hypothetical protein